MKRNFGFTLIEIIIVTVIIGLLFTTGYASYRNFSQRQTVLSEARKLEGNIRLAQELAFTGKKPQIAECNDPLQRLNGYHLKIDAANSSYAIRADCTGNSDIDIAKEFTLPTVLSISATTSDMLFKVLGQGNDIPASGVVISISMSSASIDYSVTVDKSGQVKIENKPQL